MGSVYDSGEFRNEQSNLYASVNILPIERGSVDLTEGSTSINLQSKVVPEIIATTKAEHTTRPTAMSRYTNMEMKVPSS